MAATGATRETARPKIVAAEKIVIYRTIRMGIGPDASNASTAVPVVQSNWKSKRVAPNQRQRRGGDKTKNRRRRENHEIFHDSHDSWFLVLVQVQVTRVPPWFRSCRQTEIQREAPCWD